MQGLIDQRPYGLHAVGHQLNGGVQSGNGCNQRLLHTVAQFSRRVYRPVGRQVQMHGGEVALPRGAGDHMVKKHFGLVVGIDRFKTFERIVHQLIDFCAGGTVHQPLAGTVNQPPAFAQDVERHQNRNQRVQPEPARQHDQADAYDHADGGVHIGAQMLAVGFQRDGMVHFGRFEQYPGHGGIDGRAAYGKQQPPADLLQGLRMKQAIDGNPQNAQGGDKNQQPFKAGREIFGLVVAVWMVGIGRALGDDDHEQRE